MRKHDQSKIVVSRPDNKRRLSGEKKPDCYEALMALECLDWLACECFSEQISPSRWVQQAIVHVVRTPPWPNENARGNSRRRPTPSRAASGLWADAIALLGGKR